MDDSVPLAPEGQTAVARFKDIAIRDGSSFALEKQLRDVFPARCTTPALHQPTSHPCSLDLVARSLRTRLRVVGAHR
jgi:hypothetical protein